MRVRFSFASWCPLPLSFRSPSHVFFLSSISLSISAHFRLSLCSGRLADWIYASRITPFADFGMHRAPEWRRKWFFVQWSKLFAINPRPVAFLFSLSIFLLSFRLLNPSYFESKNSAKILYEKYSFSLFSSRCHEFQNDTDCYPDFIGFNGLSSDLLYTLRNFRRKIFLYFSRLGFVLKDLYIQSSLQMRLES